MTGAPASFNRSNSFWRMSSCICNTVRSRNCKQDGGWTNLHPCGSKHLPLPGDPPLRQAFGPPELLQSLLFDKTVFAVGSVIVEGLFQRHGWVGNDTDFTQEIARGRMQHERVQEVDVACLSGGFVEGLSPCELRISHPVSPLLASLWRWRVWTRAGCERWPCAFGVVVLIPSV